MATINLNDLNSTGSYLFLDPENYLDELDNSDPAYIMGGGTPCFIAGLLLTAGLALVARTQH